MAYFLQVFIQNVILSILRIILGSGVAIEVMYYSLMLQDFQNISASTFRFGPLMIVKMIDIVLIENYHTGYFSEPTYV